MVAACDGVSACGGATMIRLRQKIRQKIQKKYRPDPSQGIGQVSRSLGAIGNMGAVPKSTSVRCQPLLPPTDACSRGERQIVLALGPYVSREKRGLRMIAVRRRGDAETHPHPRPRGRGLV